MLVFRSPVATLLPNVTCLRRRGDSSQRGGRAQRPRHRPRYRRRRQHGIGVASPRARPRGRRAERLVELSAIAERLTAVLGPERVPVWLNKPIPALDHRKPLDVIAEGGHEQVSRVVAEFESPTFG